MSTENVYEKIFEEYTLKKWPAKILKTKLRPVEGPSGSWCRAAVKRMTEVMEGLKGVGIAANQIGLDRSVCICWLNDRNLPDDVVVMVNPEIVDGGGSELSPEGCLSLPGVAGSIRRQEWVRVKWTTMGGFPEERRFEGFNARIVQHELDHLNGMCIYDKMNAIDKMASKNGIEKLQLEAGILPKRLKRKGLKLKDPADA